MIKVDKDVKNWDLRAFRPGWKWSRTCKKVRTCRALTSTLFSAPTLCLSSCTPSLAHLSHPVASTAVTACCWPKKRKRKLKKGSKQHNFTLHIRASRLLLNEVCTTMPTMPYILFLLVVGSVTTTNITSKLRELLHLSQLCLLEGEILVFLRC